MDYQFSRYVSLFEHDDVTALYHSLQIRPIYLSGKNVEVIKRLLTEKMSLTDILAMSLPDDRQAMEELFQLLVELEFLVVDNTSDDQLLARCRNEISGPYPYIAYFLLVAGCNMACKYCFEGHSEVQNRKIQKMSKATANLAIDQYVELLALKPEFSDRDKEIIFYGGEPLLNKTTLAHILKKLEKLQRQGSLPGKIKKTILTNGILLDEATIKMLIRHDVAISISIDGAKEDNVNRVFVDGEAGHDRIIAGYELCQQLGANVSISCTLSPASLENHERIIDSLIEERNVRAMGFNVLLHGSGFEVTDEYLKKATEFIIKSFEVFESRGIWEDRIYRKLKSFSNSSVMPFDCAAAGSHQLVFSPSAKVGICHSLTFDDRHMVGDLNADKIDLENNQTLTEWSRRSPLYMNECQSCPGLGICGGGCPMNAERKHGSIWSVDSNFCVHCLTTLEWLIWKLYSQLN